MDSEGALWFCQIAYDAATEEAAYEVEPATPSDLETGCNGFGWTGLSPSK